MTLTAFSSSLLYLWDLCQVSFLANIKVCQCKLFAEEVRVSIQGGVTAGKLKKKVISIEVLLLVQYLFHADEFSSAALKRHPAIGMRSAQAEGQSQLWVEGNWEPIR